MTDTAIPVHPDLVGEDDPERNPLLPGADVPAPVDYFATDTTYHIMFPDGIQYVTCKTFNEGARRKYQNAVNKDLTIKKGSGDASMKLATGDERHVLLESAIVNWNVFKGGVPQTFSSGTPGSTLSQALDAWPTELIDIIEKEIRKQEKWLRADTTVEDIDEQMEELVKLRKEAVKREAGNAN